jgi:2-dehydro-3-deoxygluconokinase
VSALPENDEADEITQPMSDLGVNLEIIWSENRVGNYHVDFSDASVTYDRADSAFAKLQAGDINWRQQLANSRWLVISGITPLLSAGARANWAAAMTFAELDGTLIALDLNHRPALGTFSELWSHVEPRLRQVNLLVVSPKTLSFIMGGCDLENLVEMRRKWNIPYLACTLKSQTPEGQVRWSAVAHSHGVETTLETSVKHQPVEPLGGGDAWLAGFIDGLLEGISPANCCRRGDLLAALTQRRFGDLGNISRDELSEWESVIGKVNLSRNG